MHVSPLAGHLRGYARQTEQVDNWVAKVGKGFERADSRNSLRMLWEWVHGLFRHRSSSIGNGWQGYYRYHHGRPMHVSSGPFQTSATAVLSSLQSVPAERIQWTILGVIFQDMLGAMNRVIISVDRFLAAIFLFNPAVNLDDIFKRLTSMRSSTLRKMKGEEYHSIYEGKNWMDGPYLQLDPETLGRNPTVQDLAAVIEQMYRKYDNKPDTDRNWIDDAVQIVKVGDNEWAVFVIGTDMDKKVGANASAANIYTGVGLPSGYQLYVKHLIETTIPPDQTINFIGHSMGAYVVMDLADTQELAAKYHISSVTTFAADSLPDKNPTLAPDVYHNYLIPGDIIKGTHYINLLGNRVDPIPDESIFGNLVERHTQYHLSEYLATQEAPFSISQWSEPKFFTATRDDLIEAGINPTETDNLSNVYFKLGPILMLASMQYATTDMMESGLISPEWRNEIDKVYDAMGEQLANPNGGTDLAGSNHAFAVESIQNTSTAIYEDIAEWAQVVGLQSETISEDVAYDAENSLDLIINFFTFDH